MLEMLHGAWSRALVRFVSDAVAFCQAQVSLTTNDFIAGAWARFLISTVVWVCFVVQRHREKR
jgi:hypothetical protein